MNPKKKKKTKAETNEYFRIYMRVKRLCKTEEERKAALDQWRKESSEKKKLCIGDIRISLQYDDYDFDEEFPVYVRDVKAYLNEKGLADGWRGNMKKLYEAGYLPCPPRQFGEDYGIFAYEVWEMAYIDCFDDLLFDDDFKSWFEELHGEELSRMAYEDYQTAIHEPRMGYWR